MKVLHMDTPEGHEQNADQIAYWNGPAGQRWADRQAAQDILLGPVADLLIDRAKADSRASGSSMSVAAAASRRSRLRSKSAPSGHALGIDISARCWRGRGRVAPKDLPVDFVLADATVYPFDPASFDLLVSRFGVMFFADPVLSFANMRKALRPSGRLAFACWREPRENPWMMAPLQAVYKHVPKLPQQGPEDPGPFAFASEERVHRILGGAGFTGIAMEPCPLSLRYRDRPRPRCGGAGRARNRPGQPRAGRPAGRSPCRGHNSMREALAPFAKGDTVLLRVRSGS